jgi:hypothetical protein
MQDYKKIVVDSEKFILNKIENAPRNNNLVDSRVLKFTKKKSFNKIKEDLIYDYIFSKTNARRFNLRLYFSKRFFSIL